MNKTKELEKEIEQLKAERRLLNQSYLSCRNETAREVLNLLLDEPWSIYIDEEIVFEIARDIYKLTVENGRVK